MDVSTLLDEYDLSLDDVRWYLSVQEAERYLRYKEYPEQLAQEIWSGRLEAALYNMEERFVADVNERLARGLTSEHRIREQLGEIRAARRRRPR
jgi:hypothetical protein